MSTVRRKSNGEYMVLSFLAIIMVVDAHCGSPLRLFTHIFPYNSFFMPLFVFISGYFFSPDKLSDLGGYIKGKFKRLIIPYYIYMFFYCGILFILKHTTPFCYGSRITLYNFFVSPWTDGERFTITNPSWFVPTLFLITVLYAVLRKILGKVWNDPAAFIVFLVIGIFAVYVSLRGIPDAYREYILQPLRVAFLMPFYQGAFCYRKYIEKKAREKVPFILVLSVTVLINFILIHRIGNIKFAVNYMTSESLAGNTSFPALLIPYVVALTGIFFWIRISRILTPALENNPFVNFVSDKTFDIMMHHVFFMTVTNWVLLLINDFFPLQGLETERIYIDCWYRYTGSSGIFNLIYFVTGFFLSVLLSYLTSRLILRIRNRH